MVTALKQIFSHVGFCSIILTDHSTSFDGSFATFLAKHNIIHYKRTARSSREAGGAEVAIKIVREHMTRIILSSSDNLRNAWDTHLYAFIASFNLRGVHNINVSRTQLYFGNKFYVSAAARFLDSDDVDQLHDKVMSRRRTGQNASPHNITENSFVIRIIPTKERKIEAGSRYLAPTSPTVYLVLDACTNSLRIMNLQTGVTSTAKPEECRLLTPSEYCSYAPSKLLNSIYQQTKPRPNGNQPMFQTQNLYLPPKDVNLFQDFNRQIEQIDKPIDNSNTIPPNQTKPEATPSPNLTGESTVKQTDHSKPNQANHEIKPRPAKPEDPNQTNPTSTAFKIPAQNQLMINDEFENEPNQTIPLPKAYKYKAPQDPIITDPPNPNKKVTFSPTRTKVSPTHEMATRSKSKL